VRCVSRVRQGHVATRQGPETTAPRPSGRGATTKRG
jgi:hypothetical protein